MTEDGIVSFREMADEDEDYKRLTGWLCNPKVREWYGADDFPSPPTVEEVKQTYAVRRLREEETRPCFILIDGSPAGYIQYYPIREHWEEDGVYGVDLLIGEDEVRDRGFGTRALREMTRFLFRQLHARKISIDPDYRNARAIRCYEKCGFRPYTRAGDFLIMVLDPPESGTGPAPTPESGS